MVAQCATARIEAIPGAPARNAAARIEEAWLALVRLAPVPALSTSPARPFRRLALPARVLVRRQDGVESVEPGREEPPRARHRARTKLRWRRPAFRRHAIAGACGRSGSDELPASCLPGNRSNLDSQPLRSCVGPATAAHWVRTKKTSPVISIPARNATENGNELPGPAGDPPVPQDGSRPPPTSTYAILAFVPLGAMAVSPGAEFRPGRRTAASLVRRIRSSRTVDGGPARSTAGQRGQREVRACTIS